MDCFVACAPRNDGGYRQWKTKLAMTSIAVIASTCASISEAALLVASFMPFSLDLGVTHRPRERAHATVRFLLETPRDKYSL